MRFVFLPTGEVTWFVNELGFIKLAPSGLRGRYSLRPSFPYYDLGIDSFQDSRFAGFRMLGILRPISPSQFVLDFLPPSNRDTRLKNFTSKAVVFSRRQ